MSLLRVVEERLEWREAAEAGVVLAVVEALISGLSQYSLARWVREARAGVMI